MMDIIFLLILFAWFTLILPGVRIGSFNLCGSAVKEKSKPEIIMWFVFLLLLTPYILGNFAGIAAAFLFLLMWIIAQWIFTLRFIFLPNETKIKGYNKHFEDMHHIIKPSSKRLVPDTYHIVLFALIIICLVTTAVRLISLHMA